jgi:CBS-domain-containing membrane protein
MKVSEVMCRQVTTVSPNTPVRNLWKLIFTNKINAVPVIDSKKIIVGIVAKDDLLTLLYPNYEEFIADFTSGSDFEEMERKVRNIGNKIAKDIMKKNVICVHEHIPLMRALSRMIVHHIDQLPVLSQTNKLVGIITKGDIFKALFRKRLAVVYRK